MSRVRTLFITILPSAIAGGFLFASAFGHADAGRDSAVGLWPAAGGAGPVLVAQAEPRPAAAPRYIPPPPPASPVAPVPPVPPVPPAPGSSHSSHSRGGHGMSFSIHDGKVEIDGIAELVQDSLEKALEALDNLPDVPPEVRGRLRGRIQAVRGTLRGRLARLKSLDLDKLGPEMERMGDEIEREMEGIDRDLAKLGEKFGKNFAEKYGKDFVGKYKGYGPSGAPSAGPAPSHDSDDGDDDDDDDDNEVAGLPPSPDSDSDGDPAEVGPAIAAIKGLALDDGQRAQLQKLRHDADDRLGNAKRELHDMSERLHNTLRDANAREDDIARQIDSISAKEAEIRKVRILSWVKARQLLRKDQRKMVEGAVKKSH